MAILSFGYAVIDAIKALRQLFQGHMKYAIHDQDVMGSNLVWSNLGYIVFHGAGPRFGHTCEISCMFTSGF